MNKWQKFIEAPENRTGLSIWLGTALTACVQIFVLHIHPSSADLLGVVLGLVKILQPENSVTVAQLERAIADVSHALEAPSEGSIGAALNDAEAIAAGVLTKTST
jgi:hypothetical protein